VDRAVVNKYSNNNGKYAGIGLVQQRKQRMTVDANIILIMEDVQ
jgi:hypothetical protein